MLHKIHLRNFKKFQDAEILLSPFTVLMGENSSGKTTILQAINFALQGLYDLHIRSIDKNKNSAPQIAGESKIYYIDELPALNISRVGELYYGGKASSQKPAYIEMEDIYNNNYCLQISSTYNIKSKFGNFNVKCTACDIKDPLAFPRLSHPLFISGFAGLNSTEERKFPKAILDRVQTGRMSEIIRNLILDIKIQAERNVYEQFTGILESYFNFHIDTIKFDEKQDLYIAALFSEMRDQGRISLNLNSSGSGLLQVLQILAPIYRFASKGTVVLLDEPDAHLHTNMQYTLAQALREVQSQLDIQIIISTHSIPMIETVDSSEVVPVYAQLQQIEPLTSKADVDQAIADLIDNFHLAKAKISGKILFIEDEKIDILKGLDKASGINCFQGIDTIPYVAGGGKDNKAPFSSKKILKEYTGRDIDVHFIVDGDAMPVKWRRHFAKFAEGKLILHQLMRHEIENYLINPELLMRALRVKFPRKEKEIPGVEEIKSKLTGIMRECMFGEGIYLKDDIKQRIGNLLALRSLVEEKFIDENGQEKVELKSYGLDQKEREARNIAESYLSYTDFEQLILVAPGKESLRRFRGWLGEHKKMPLSNIDITRCLTGDDVPDEIKQLLAQLHSNVTGLPDNPQKQSSGKKRIKLSISDSGE